MINIKKSIDTLRDEGLSKNSIIKLFFEKHTHFLLFKKLDSTPNIIHALIDIDFRFIKKNNYRKNKKYVKEISSMMFENFEKINLKFHNNSECLIAIFNKSLVGYIWINFNNYKTKGIKNLIRMGPKGVYIGPAYITPKFRGKKIYEALLSRSFKYVYDLGYTQVYGAVSHNNIPSIKGCLKQKYEPIEIHYRIRIGPFVIYPKSKKEDLEYYSKIYYQLRDSFIRKNSYFKK